MGIRAPAAARILGDATLRRVVVSYALFIAAEYAAWISILVWAYGQGGAVEAGAIALAQLVPAAVVAPFVASIADRRSPGVLLVGGYAVQAAALGGTALAAETGHSALVWSCAVLAATAVVTTRPALATILPSIVHRVEELAAANATVGWVESGGVAAAGIFSGVAVGAFGAGAGIAVAAALAAAAAASAAAVLHAKPASAEGETSPLREDLVKGFAAVHRNDAARFLLGMQTASWVVVGALDILFVVLAVRVLGDGPGWVGYLNTAYGAGGIVAGLAAVGLVGARRLSVPILSGAAALSVGLAVLAAVPSTIAAVVLLSCAGCGRALFDISTRTLLQRIVAADVLGRVFGLAEASSMAGLAIGSVAAPALVAGVGPRGALVGAALVMPLVVAIFGRRLLVLDRTARVPVVEIALLRSLPLFRRLPGPALETAARSLVPVEFEAGEALISEADVVADRFYALASGEVDVIRGGVPVARLGRGEGVGEMALLRAAPRTATVVARTRVLGYALDRTPFLIAVTGHAATAAAADVVVDSRLAQLERLQTVPDPE